MTKPWNQAAWRQNTYSKRVSPKPVGDETNNRGGVDTVCCRRCGYYVHNETCPGHADYVAPNDVTFRLAETKPELLTLDEAAEACRAGKVVRCVEDRDETFIGDKFRFYEPCGFFQVESLGRKSWTAALDFPYWPGDMRFEVVE